VNGPDRLRVCRPEGAEVVSADEDRPGPLHRGGVEWDPDPERCALAEGAPRPVPDGVAILPVARRVARVEPRRRTPHVADRDVGREERIERPPQLLCREPPGVGECDHLPRGVHTGVGPACPVNRLTLPIAEARQRGFEFSLDRPDSRLSLEAGEVRPVIFNPCAVPASRLVLLGRALSDAFGGGQLNELDLDNGRGVATS
jgi:hypothetical protein